jgi:hypothetical protein
MKVLFALLILFLSYVIRVFGALNHKTYETNKIPILHSATSQFIVIIIWIGLLIWAGCLLYDVSPIAIFIGLLLYFFVFNFFFLKRFIRYFGGDLVFPDSLKHCRGIIKAMVFAYTSIKEKNRDISKTEVLLKTLKSRYPFMKDGKRKEIVEKCNDIRKLIYEVLKIDLIDFDVKKYQPTKKLVDEVIDEMMALGEKRYLDG